MAPDEETLLAGYDMHSHTDFSDGTTTIEHNVAVALSVGLDGLGVTDHDTTAPYARARAAAAGTGLDLVLGTEFSAEHRGTSVHVLGFWIDPDDVALSAELERLRNQRARRAAEIVTKFHELGIEISLSRVQQLAGQAPIGRPHLARAVVETGAVADLQTVFDEYLADGGPAYVPKYAVDPVTAVQLIRGAGGVAVVAHPGLYGGTGDDGGMADSLVEAMAEAGMAAVEADHPDHTAAQRTRYRRLAEGLQLLVTAGSDFHGDVKDLQLGQSRTPAVVVAQLRARRP